MGKLHARMAGGVLLLMLAPALADEAPSEVDPNYSEPIPITSPEPPAEPVAPMPPMAETPPMVETPPVRYDETYRLASPSYLGTMATYTYPGEDRPDNIDHALGFHALYGYMNKSHWGFEIGFFGDIFETGDDATMDYYRLGTGADLVLSLGDRTEFTPFVLVGGGGDYNDVLPDENDKFSWYANGGVGFVTGPFTERGLLRMRAEVRYVYDDHLEGNSDYRGSIGLEIPLFEEHRPSQQVVIRDRVQVVELATGFNDSDGDGVVDESDRCPDTPANTRVDGEGCTLPQIIELKGVTFEFNQARLRPDAQVILDSAIMILKRYPDMQVEVAGHTDNVGGDDYNLRLSERRAQSVADYFRTHGVPGEQLTVKGYGEAEPLVENETEEGRERNRRVELRILN